MPIAETSNPTLQNLLPLKAQLFPRDQKLLHLECGATGPQDAKIAIIGEAPGELEQRDGTPFIGTAGEKLDEFLGAWGIPRSQCYITNVVKERPFDNDISRFIRFHKNTDSLNVETEAFAAYKKLLHLELDSLPSDCILVPMGKVPFWAICGSSAILNYRGSILEARSKKTIPTYHPAATLYDPLVSFQIVHDLKRVSDELKVSGIVRPERTLDTRPNFEEAKSYLEMLLNQTETVAFDIEVLNQQVCCISFSHDPAYAMTIAFVDAQGCVFDNDEERDLWLLIAQLLEDPSIPVLAHNSIFDASFLYERYGIRCQNLHCSLVAHNCLYPDLKHSLAFLTSWYTREPYYKDQGKDAISGLPHDEIEFWEYCAKDSATCLESWLQIAPALRKLGNWDTYLRQVSTIPQLTYMQARGIKMDIPGIANIDSELDAELKEHHIRLEKALGREVPTTFAGSNGKGGQLYDHFVTRGRIKPYIDRKSGNATFNDLAMSRLARRGFAEASIIQDIRAAKKMKGSYVETLLDPDNRCRSAWNPAGTRTGRFSTQKLWRGGTGAREVKVGLPLQIIPHSFRKYLLVDPGYLLFDIDLSQAENRIVAWFGPEPTMKQAFLDGVDVHSLTAALIFGKDIEDISDEKGSCPLAGGRYSERKWGKESNHAFNYGRSYKSFSLDMELPEKDGKRIHKRYHTVYPGVQDNFHQRIRDEYYQNKHIITNPYGRKRRFQKKLSGDTLEAAYAQVPQSTVADKMIIDGHQFMEQYEGELFEPVELLSQVHDSLYIQIPKAIGWDHMSLILTELTSSLEKPIDIEGEMLSIPTDTKMGLNMGQMNELESLLPEALQASEEELYHATRN